MKRIFFLPLLLLLSMSEAHSQQWMPYNNQLARTTFQMPGIATEDSDNDAKLKMYASEVDTLLGAQVTIVDSAYMDVQDVMWANALQINGNDTLRAIAQMLLLVSNSNLVSINDITVAGRQGLEIGIEYNELIEDEPTLTFMRYFLIDHKFITYSISGSSNDLMRLTNFKDTFFSSINFY